MLLAVFELPLIVTFIRPLLNPLPVLLVVLPVAFVDCAISVVVYAEPVCFVVHPLSLKGVPIWVLQPTFSIDLVVTELALIDTAVGKSLFPRPVSVVIDPLSFISTARLKSYNIFHLSELPPHFLGDELEKQILLMIFLSVVPPR